MKKKINLLLLSIASVIILCFYSCGSANGNTEKIHLEQQPPFEIASAYYQNWVAGIKEGGSGTYIHILFTSMDKNVEVKDIYFNESILEAKSTLQKPMEYTGYLKVNSGRDVVMHSNPTKEAQNTPSESFPFQLEGNEAVIAYMFSGTKHYYKITNIAQKEILAYPQGNPDEQGHD